MDSSLENNEAKGLARAWIWFWYNDATRFLLILLGGHLLITGTLVSLVVEGPMRRDAFVVLYTLGLVLGMLDNDYASNLQRIGLDVDRQKLKTSKSVRREPTLD